MPATPFLVLASASTARLALLRAAGLDPTPRPAFLDEDAIKRRARAAELSAGEAALLLATAKADTVPAANALVIGADQILSCEGTWFDKPPDRAAAAAHLRALSGRTHVLHTAVVLHDAHGLVWRHLAEPRLRMRPLDEAAIAAYLDAEGDAVLGSVGAYLLERHGRALFEAVDGDETAVLGLPMPPLLAALRRHGLCPEP
ncbi:MAG: Maf family protein [Gluconacetobacter diazotrophicus]|nr:Maf family protein [Gluconacetobacter diazotrophicus]